MASSVIRRRWFGGSGWANPNAPALAAGSTAAASTVTIKFGSTILPASPAVGQFSCTVAGVARTINAAACATVNLTLTLASAVTAGQAVVVTYVPGYVTPLRNANGDLVSGFTSSITAT